MQAMEPGAQVRRGQWVVGPDGRRELDVVVRGHTEGQRRSVLVECKDFDPGSTGPVGIGYVDALESKQRDLGIGFAMLCTNAGFTADAVRKAARVGIGLVGVMRKGDGRIRFAVTEDLYTRKVKVEELKISLRGPSPIDLTNVRFEEVLSEGVPVGNWVTRRVMLFVGSNPIVSGSYTASHQFRRPVEFEIPSGPVVVENLGFQLRITGAWFEQQITIDATHGLYDWIRHRVRLAPGPGQLFLNGVNLDAGQQVDRPPERELAQRDLRRGEVNIALMMLSGLDVREPSPNLGAQIEPDDLDVFLKDLTPEMYTSVGA